MRYILGSLFGILLLSAAPDGYCLPGSNRLLQDSVPAHFPGGKSEWRRFLEKHVSYDTIVMLGGPPGAYIPIVSFVVRENGEITDIKVVHDPGYEAAGELVRAIKKSPRWVPALKNGKPVASEQREQMIIDVMEEEEIPRKE